MTIYRIEATLHATAYVRADSPEEALAIAKQQIGDFVEAADDGETFTCKDYSDPDLPDFSFSPAMTIGGFDEEAEEASDDD
jgi:hypothetical protein